jgi:beta-lactamase class D
VEGSVTIFDLKTGEWLFSDAEDASRGTIPASTFKVCNALIALEEGAIDPGEVIRWDGVEKLFKGKPVKAWNADANLESAFKNSTIWFFAELSRRVPRTTYRNYLREIGYGNCDVSEKGDDFWNYGAMRMTPREQAAFIARLYKEDLPFKKENIRLIKGYMAIAKNAEYALSGKSGWGIQGGKDIGWLVGYLETGDRAYAFATRIIANSDAVPPDFGALRTSVTLEAFRNAGIIH